MSVSKNPLLTDLPTSKSFKWRQERSCNPGMTWLTNPRWLTLRCMYTNKKNYVCIRDSIKNPRTDWKVFGKFLSVYRQWNWWGEGVGGYLVVEWEEGGFSWTSWIRCGSKNLLPKGQAFASPYWLCCLYCFFNIVFVLICKVAICIEMLQPVRPDLVFFLLFYLVNNNNNSNNYYYYYSWFSVSFLQLLHFLPRGRRPSVLSQTIPFFSFLSFLLFNCFYLLLFAFPFELHWEFPNPHK